MTCLPDMLFEMETEDDCSTLREAAAASDRCGADVLHTVQHLTSCKPGFEAELAADVVVLRARMLAQEARIDSVVVAAQLAACGYSVRVRAAIGGGGRTADLYNSLSHEFIVVDGAAECAGVEYIVDLDFPEHFRVSAPSRAYEELIAALPVCFVGPSMRLVPLVQSIAGALKAVFVAADRPCPPWRSTTAMLSKWMPKRLKDSVITPPSGAAETHRLFAGGPDTGASMQPRRMLSGFLAPAAA